MAAPRWLPAFAAANAVIALTFGTFAAHGIKGNPHGGVGLAELLLELENGPALVHAATAAQLVPHLGLAALGALADARFGQKVVSPALPGPRMGMSSLG